MRWGPVCLAGWALGAVLAAGCDVPPCSEGPSLDPGAPRITDLELAGQLEGDPYTVILRMEVADPEGDLGHGTAVFFLDGTLSNIELELFDLFRQSALDEDATAGAVALPLRFSEDVANGARVRLGVQVLDEGGRRSNCYSLELDFAVEGG